MATFLERFRRAAAVLRSGGGSDGRHSLYGNLTGGGIVNHGSGMGTGLDKGEASYFQPTRLFTRYPLEVLCVQSWAARSAVSMRTRDMFLRQRIYPELTPERTEEIEAAMKRLEVDETISRAMVAGKQYGTALLILMTREAPMDTPLVPEQIREGDLTALRVVNRYDCSVALRDYDIFSPTYGGPLFYDVHPNVGGLPIRVHESRVIRFDGITDPGDARLTSYEQDWGVSSLVPILQSVLQETAIAQATTHLMQEASVPVMYIEGLREAMSGRAPQEASPEEIGDGINKLKSIYRLLMLEKGAEEFARIPVNFAGIADLMDRSARRVAAAAEIPLTRFWGTSPVGLNATGDGDMRNYVLTLEAERQNILPPVYDRIDEIIFRSEGLGDPEEYRWPSLLELGEDEIAQAAKTKAEALAAAINAGIMDEDEARDALSGDEVFGELSGEAPGLPEPILPPAPPGGGGAKPPGEGAKPAGGAKPSGGKPSPSPAPKK